MNCNRLLLLFPFTLLLTGCGVGVPSLDTLKSIVKESDLHTYVSDSNEKVSLSDASSPISRLAELPKTLSESSGIVVIDGRYFTHNDSGGEVALYEIDTNGTIVRTIPLTNATNIDWEDLAQDREALYIGDIGNNDGSRRDLKIYKIDKEALLKEESVEAEVISFGYEDQQDFSSRTYATAFDAEALFATEERLMIMTKNWRDKTLRLYALPKTPGNYKAELITEKKIDFLITSADYDSASDLLAVTGYSGITAAGRTVALFERFSEQKLDRMEDITPSSLPVGFKQIEAVTFDENGDLLITSEQFDYPPLPKAPAAIFKMALP